MLPRDSVKKGDACHHRNHGKDICTVLMVATMDRCMGVKVQKAKVLWMTGKNLGRTHIVHARDLTKVEK